MQDIRTGYLTAAGHNGAPGDELGDMPPAPGAEVSVTHQQPLSEGAVLYVGGLAEVGTDEPSVATGTEAMAHADRSAEVFRLRRDPTSYRVEVESDLTAEHYRDITHPDDWELLKEEARALEGTTWVFINPTMEGGGVAMIRPPTVHLMRQFGIDAHWHVMAPIENPAEQGNPFLVTKKMHNISQRVTDERLTEEEKRLHRLWADEQNGVVLAAQPNIAQADFIVIDDPQPAPAIARLREANPNARFIWRNHIDTHHDLMSDPDTPQGEVASYLLDECGVREVDAVLAHPVEAFMHPGMEDRTFLAPATFDPFDNLNRHLSEAEVQEGVRFINEEIARKNVELAADGRGADIQPLLDTNPERQRLTLIARFDPSKGMDKAMEMGVMTRRKLREQGVPEEELPEVVIVGNGSIDDPDGVWMFEQMLQLRRERYPEETDGITVMRLRHNYDAMNALMSRSTIVMQTSDAEGLETRVSDAIKHGKPVVVSNRGGIHTQVMEGQSGIILDYDKPDRDLERGAQFMAGLLADPEAYAAMVQSTKRQAASHNIREFTTTANVTRLLHAANHLRTKPGVPAGKTWKISEMVAQAREQASQELAA